MSRPACLAIPVLVALHSCATVPVALPSREGAVLVLPLEVRGKLPEEATGLGEALREAVTAAGSPVALPDPAAPPLRGHEPDAVIRTAAGAGGARWALAAWVAEAGEGRLLFSARLVDVPAAATLDGAAGIVPAAQAARALRAAAAKLLRGPPEPSPRGERTVDDLAKHLQSHAGLFDACLAERSYVREGLSGNAAIEVTVDVRGAVTGAEVRTDLEDPAAEACLLDAARQLRFPEGVGGLTTLRRGLTWPR